MVASIAQTVLSYFDVLVWPFIVLVLGGGSILLFRPQIADLIKNIRKARFPGGEIETGPQPQDPEQAEKLREELEAAEEPGTVEDGPDGSAPVSTGAELELSNMRANLQALAKEIHFERVYRTIYGTQISLLQQLQLHKNEVPNHTSFTIHEVQNVWRVHEHLTPLHASFRDWLLYLRNVGLVHTPGDRIEISSTGTEFLLFLMRERLAEKLY